MFTVFVRSGEIKTRLDAATTDFQARMLARRWSRTMKFQVIVLEDGHDTPRCIYQEGLELFCACPGTGAAPPTEGLVLPTQSA